MFNPTRNCGRCQAVATDTEIFNPFQFWPCFKRELPSKRAQETRFLQAFNQLRNLDQFYWTTQKCNASSRFNPDAAENFNEPIFAPEKQIAPTISSEPGIRPPGACTSNGEMHCDVRVALDRRHWVDLTWTAQSRQGPEPCLPT
jgi:hypothetical protein